jgi:DNA-binding NarL/FixJ family response regulator
MKKLGDEAIKTEGKEFIAIELNETLCKALDALISSGFAASYSNALVRSVNLVSEQLAHRLPVSEGFSHYKASSPLPKLSRRQKELLPLLNLGLSNREVADRLNLSEHTVKVHLWRLFKKMNVSNRTQLLYLARLHGWI